MIPKIDFIKFLVALSLIAAFNFTIYALAYVEIPEGNRELFIHVIGMIDGAFVGSLVGFYYTRSPRVEKDHNGSDSGKEG